MLDPDGGALLSAIGATGAAEDGEALATASPAGPLGTSPWEPPYRPDVTLAEGEVELAVDDLGRAGGALPPEDVEVGVVAPVAPLLSESAAGEGGANVGASPPLPIGDAFDTEPPEVIFSMKADIAWGTFPAAPAAEAPPVATAAPTAAPAAAACATSAVPMEVDPEAKVAAIESDLKVRYASKK